MPLLYVKVYTIYVLGNNEAGDDNTNNNKTWLNL